eukprot:11692643-Heterocapsa_arctica.AAC.1
MVLWAPDSGGRSPWPLQAGPWVLEVLQLLYELAGMPRQFDSQELEEQITPGHQHRSWKYPNEGSKRGRE